MTTEQLRALLEQGERDTLDWKRDHPLGLNSAESTPEEKLRARGTLLKDVAAMANTVESGCGYIVYGVADSSTKRTVLGVSSVIDDAQLQDWVANAFNPPIAVAYETFVLDGKSVGVLTVSAASRYPHVAEQSVGDKLHQGQVWYRRGTKNTVASYDDLRRMFDDAEHMIDESASGHVVRQATDHYRDLGMSTELVTWNQRHGMLLKGAAFAVFPGTRRKVVVMPYGTTSPDVVLMLSPKKT